MGNINKDIERCKELIKTEHSNWIGLTNQDAISNVLKELETRTVQVSGQVQELDTYKKIAEFLADKGNFDHYSYCESNIFSCNAKTPKKTCKQCIIDWARKEVEKDV